VEFLFDLLREHFQRHGYWTVAIALLLENAGVPVPGETILLFASFVAYSQGTIRLSVLIPLAVVSAVIGDNVGYWIGLRGGRPLLERYQRFFRISHETLTKGERSFERFGPATVFIARFVFGLRVIAGPLAGVLRMPWRRFVLYNVLGATVWVGAMVTIGSLFGRHWNRVVEVLGEVNGAIVVVVVIAGWFAWRHYRKLK
jgi:membrane-associated protein